MNFCAFAYWVFARLLSRFYTKPSLVDFFCNKKFLVQNQFITVVFFIHTKKVNNLKFSDKTKMQQKKIPFAKLKTKLIWMQSIVKSNRLFKFCVLHTTAPMITHKCESVIQTLVCHTQCNFDKYYSGTRTLDVFVCKNRLAMSRMASVYSLRKQMS